MYGDITPDDWDEGEPMDEEAYEALSGGGHRPGWPGGTV